jgi:OTU domain-containing protein 3
MQNSGVFGDNLEIQAFAREFGINVKIYQRKFAYVITADNESGSADKNRKAVHIAYHVSSHLREAWV